MTNLQRCRTIPSAGTDEKALLTRNTSGSSSRSIEYGRADQYGNPTLVTYKVGSNTAQLITDPDTGQAIMLATPSHVDGLYVYDGYGNPVGIVVNSASAYGEQYDPYGVPTVTYDGGGDGLSSNPYAFKGGTVSQAVGIVKFGLRWYDPYTGAWMQDDTIDALTSEFSIGCNLAASIIAAPTIAGTLLAIGGCYVASKLLEAALEEDSK